MALSLSGSYARKYRTIPGLPSESKVVTLTFQPAAICAPRTCLALNPIADLFNWRGPDLLLIVWFAHDRGFIGPILVLFIFVLVIIFIVRISRWCRVACDSENLVDASSPLLLQTSMKLYGIHGHVVLLLTFVFEGGACSGSSPSASAQYISASFRHWQLCRGDFATAARRANFFAFAR